MARRSNGEGNRRGPRGEINTHNSVVYGCEPCVAPIEGTHIRQPGGNVSIAVRRSSNLATRGGVTSRISRYRLKRRYVKQGLLIYTKYTVPTAVAAQNLQIPCQEPAIEPPSRSR